jgi:hypothetical protein
MAFPLQRLTSIPDSSLQTAIFRGRSSKPSHADQNLLQLLKPQKPSLIQHRIELSTNCGRQMALKPDVTVLSANSKTALRDRMPSAAQVVSLVTFFGPAKKDIRLPAGTGEVEICS